MTDNGQIFKKRVVRTKNKHSLNFSILSHLKKTGHGGAFAIATLFKEQIKDHGNAPFLGALSIDTLAIGAVLFSWLMWIDIWAWGSMMRRYFNALCPKEEWTKLGLEVFTYAGKAILTLLVLLVTGGWLLAANSRYAVAVSTISVLVIIGLIEGAKFSQRWRDGLTGRGHG